MLCAALVLGGLMIYGKARMGKIPGLTFMDALNYTTQGKPDARITVGIIKDGQASFTVYGDNGQILPEENHTYEIGSLTKTITAALISRAITEGRIRLDDTIDMYLPLPEGNHYPTVRELLTHTSGYCAYYFESPMIFPRVSAGKRHNRANRAPLRFACGTRLPTTLHLPLAFFC